MIDLQAARYAGPLRRQLVEGSRLNGIDYLALDPRNPQRLHVYFLKPLPAHAYGLLEHPEHIVVQGGYRVAGLRAVDVIRVRPSRAAAEEPHLRVTLDRVGDASQYTLQIDVPELDPCLRRAEFTFSAGQTIQSDCEIVAPPPPAPPEPALDYEAKDYESFRQVLLDLLPRLNPRWTEVSGADLGIAVLELFAYVGDQLSYLQDAVANEAYLDRVRLRISARRLARLLDYHMHDGRNAWTWCHFEVQSAGTVPLGTRLVTRIEGALRGQVEAPQAMIVDTARYAPIVDANGVVQWIHENSLITADTLETDPALVTATVFETAHSQAVDPLNNTIRIHDWGIPGSELEVGATAAFLYSVGADHRAVRPKLALGDWLLLEEVHARDTGPPDPGHRQVVQLDEEPTFLEDEVFADLLVGDRLQLRSCPNARGSGALPLVMVHWRAADAVGSPFLLSAPADSIDGCPDSAAPAPPRFVVARGNLIAADHGLTRTEQLGGPGLRFGPLTMQCPPAIYGLADDKTALRLASERRDLACDPRQAQPAIALRVGEEVWTPIGDLLESGPFDRCFVVEVDEAGNAHLRFGDGVEGREAPADPNGACFVTYRVGNGRSGEIGAGTLNHVVVEDSSQPWLAQIKVTNPLAAHGAAEPETVDEVRTRAPQSASVQQRAVTEADYRAAALGVPGVAAAAASLRWTGSWYTAFVGVVPAPDASLSDVLAAALDQLERFRLASHDLELRPPRYVGLDIGLQVTIGAGHFRNEVLAEVATVVADLFAQPDSFTFGTPVYLSQIFAVVAAVEGAEAVVATRFGRSGAPDAGELAAGVIPMGTFDIARLANDPHHPELGVLQLSAVGGKG